MSHELPQTLQHLQGVLAALGGDVAQVQVEVVEEQLLLLYLMELY